MPTTHLKRLNFGPFVKGTGLDFEKYMLNALNQIERWSYEVNQVIGETGTSGAEDVDELLLETDDFLLRQSGGSDTLGLE